MSAPFPPYKMGRPATIIPEGMLLTQDGAEAWLVRDLPFIPQLDALYALAGIRDFDGDGADRPHLWKARIILLRRNGHERCLLGVKLKERGQGDGRHRVLGAQDFADCHQHVLSAIGPHTRAVDRIPAAYAWGLLREPGTFRQANLADAGGRYQDWATRLLDDRQAGASVALLEMSIDEEGIRARGFANLVNTPEHVGPLDGYPDFAESGHQPSPTGFPIAHPPLYLTPEEIVDFGFCISADQVVS